MLRSWLVAASLVTVTSLSYADGVVLKDGTKLHGKLREVAPNSAVTILLEDGELRTIEWAAVDRVDRTDDADKSWVHVVDAGVAHVEMSSGDHAWVTVCRGACDENLVRGGIYRIAGQGIRASHPFRLDAENATIAIHPASSQAFGGALAMLIIGAAALVNGVTLAVEEATSRSNPGYPPNDAFFIAAGVLGGLAVPLLLGGAFLLRSNLTTSVTISF